MRHVPADPSTYDEILVLVDEGAGGNDPTFERVNLGPIETGINGYIVVTTRMGKLGPRVRYRLSLDEGAPSFSVSISATPQVVAASMEQREIDRRRLKVQTWVCLNRAALLRFWLHAETWTVDEVDEFCNRIQKV